MAVLRRAWLCTCTVECSCPCLCLAQLNVIDIVAYLIWIGVSSSDEDAIRWSRCLRPLILVNFVEGKHVSAPHALQSLCSGMMPPVSTAYAPCIHFFCAAPMLFQLARR